MLVSRAGFAFNHQNNSRLTSLSENMTVSVAANSSHSYRQPHQTSLSHLAPSRISIKFRSRASQERVSQGRLLCDVLGAAVCWSVHERELVLEKMVAEEMAEKSDGDVGSPQPVGENAKRVEEKTADERALEGRVRWMTSKREFRARAHSNPLNDGLFTPPKDPSHLPMDRLYANPPNEHVVWCDVGCGYGGLLASLSAAYPEKTMLGLEIRDRVAEFCRRRVTEMRREYPGSYGNVAFERTNAMKYLVNYFGKSSLEKIFFCYPDPHFKKKKNRQRIISTQLLAEYAYVLREGEGVAYIVTDVPELFEWMVERFEKHPLFRRRTAEEHAADVVTRYVRNFTDEAQRVDKSERGKQDASFLRIKNP